MKTLTIITFLVTTLTGCAASQTQLRTVSSGKVGCAPDAITVENYKLGATTSSWTASCNGQTYYCSADDMLRGASCAGR